MFLFKNPGKKALLFGLLIIPFSTQNSLGQSTSDSTYFFVGLDLGKTIYANIKPGANSGFTAEIIGRKGKTQGNKVSHGFFFSAGYSYLSRDTIYPNVDYKCQGYFFRLGLELYHPFPRLDKKPVILTYGLNFVGSQFQNSGIFKIEGDYFPDYRKPYSKNYSSYGLQLATQASFPLGQKWWLSGGLVWGYLMNPVSKNSTNEVTYYQPGIGFTRENRWAVGASFHLLYQL